MQCREFREIACVFLDDELTVETNHEVISHFEKCVNCHHEVAARRDFRLKLHHAIANSPEVQMSDEFVKRLHTQLRVRTWKGKLFGSFTQN